MAALSSEALEAFGALHTLVRLVAAWEIPRADPIHTELAPSPESVPILLARADRLLGRYTPGKDPYVATIVELSRSLRELVPRETRIAELRAELKKLTREGVAP